MRKLEKYVQTHLQTELDIIRTSERANVLPELSLEEKAIIYRYTDTGHFVNEILREKKGEKVPKFAKHLKSVLAKLPSYNFLVYRGEPISNLKIYQNALESKQVITAFAFSSCSVRREPALQFGQILLRIISKNGKLIEKVSKFGKNLPFNEQEVLFTMVSKFIVLDIKEENNLPIITLEEL